MMCCAEQGLGDVTSIGPFQLQAMRKASFVNAAFISVSILVIKARPCSAEKTFKWLMDVPSILLAHFATPNSLTPLFPPPAKQCILP